MSEDKKIQSIEELRRRHDELRDRKIRVGTQLEDAQRHLNELKEQAIKEFGTDDVEELTAKLNAIRAENDAKRKEYQASLEAIEAKLTEVEREFKVTE